MGKSTLTICLLALVCLAINPGCKGQTHRYDIEKIEFHDNGVCEGDCPIIDIYIDVKALTGTYRIGYFDSKLEGKSGTVSQVRIKGLVKLLNEADFPALQATYTVTRTDQTTARWTIIYDHGKQKSIEDYGHCSDTSIAGLYKYITNL